RYVRTVTTLYFPLFSSHLPPPPLTYPLSLHDALPISFILPSRSTPIPAPWRPSPIVSSARVSLRPSSVEPSRDPSGTHDRRGSRSEEHTSELQSRGHLVCRLLLEKKKKNKITD